jgi:hypothetical protein
MAVRSIRSIVARFVVITGLAASLFAGSSALVGPRDASAANFYCDQAAYYASGALAAWSVGRYAVGNVYLTTALYYSDRCPDDPWA